MSSRRGAWVRQRQYGRGLHYDLIGSRFSWFLLMSLPDKILNSIMERGVNKNLDHTGLKPDHPVNAQQCMINDNLPNRLINGSNIGLQFLARGLSISHEIRMKSGGFHVDFTWNLADFTWNPADFMKSLVIAPTLHSSNWRVFAETLAFIILGGFHRWNLGEIHQISRVKSPNLHSSNSRVFAETLAFIILDGFHRWYLGEIHWISQVKSTRFQGEIWWISWNPWS